MTVHHGHLQIHQNQGIFSRLGSLNLFHRHAAVAGGVHQKSGVFQQIHLNFSVQLVIFYHQNFLGARRRLACGLFLFFRLFLETQRQADREAASFAQSAFHLNGAAHHFHNIFGDRQAQAGAKNAAHRAVLLPLKGFKNMLDKIRADSNAGILYDKLISRKLAGGVLLPERNRNPAAALRIFHRVEGDANDHLGQLFLIDIYQSLPQFAQVHHQLHALFLGLRQNDILNILGHLQQAAHLFLNMDTA